MVRLQAADMLTQCGHSLQNEFSAAKCDLTASLPVGISFPF